jgi:hypothetical protein
VIGSKDTSVLCSAPDFRTSRARALTTAPRSTVPDGAVTGRLRSGIVNLKFTGLTHILGQF